MNFSSVNLGHDYPNFLGQLGIGRPFISFEQARLGVPGVLLRHDVDISLDSAHRMALIENTLGVKATYFVMVTSDFYNPAEAAQLMLIRGLVDLGHAIGLHFDQNAYDASNNFDLNQSIAAEAKWLEHLADTEVKAVSFHNPSLTGSTPGLEVYSGLTNAYASSIMEAYEYWSDSAGRWSKKDGLESAKESTNLQLLIHPEWWFDLEKSNLRRVGEAVIGRASNTFLSHVDRVFESSGAYGNLRSTQIRDDSGRQEDPVSIFHEILRRLLY